MSLDNGRKTKYPKEMHTDPGRPAGNQTQALFAVRRQAYPLFILHRYEYMCYLYSETKIVHKPPVLKHDAYT